MNRFLNIFFEKTKSSTLKSEKVEEILNKPLSFFCWGEMPIIYQDRRRESINKRHDSLLGDAYKYINGKWSPMLRHDFEDYADEITDEKHFSKIFSKEMILEYCNYCIQVSEQLNDLSDWLP